MARDIDKRLRSLSARRKGTDRISDLSYDSALEILAKSTVPEAYSKRAMSQKHTQYALGAMQAVDLDYTRISLEEAERVSGQLKTGLSRKSIPVDFRLQGSVACDIHIRGVSDVDLLVLDDRYIRYDTDGAKSQTNGYTNRVTYDTLLALIQLRQDSETVLENAFPKAKVNKSGAKSINISGGSLRRPVDVVPSNWFDTVMFQLTGNEADRGVQILNKEVPERIFNTPFKHIQLINQRDDLTIGGLKKAIRLCKNVKADAIDDGTKIELSSFDIAAVMWHADTSRLTVGIANELAILAEATRFLDFLARRTTYAQTLQVPDGSRNIFDSKDKVEGLRLLSLEMDDLSERVAREQSNKLGHWSASAEILLDELRKVYIPT